MTLSEDLVESDRVGPVAVLTFNRPDRLNAWNRQLQRRYTERLVEAVEDPEVRAIVITGSGRAFCAGADLESVERLGASSRSGTSAQGSSGDQPIGFPLGVPKPMVAAVNGACAGLGLTQALMCDVRFVDEEARLTTAFVRRGLVNEHGMAWLLSRLTSRSTVLDLMLSGRVITAPEALRLGIADHVVPSGRAVEEAVNYAGKLVESCSPTSMAVIKHQVRLAGQLSYHDACAIDDVLARQSWRRSDLVEGVASFKERRAPRFPPLDLEAVQDAVDASRELLAPGRKDGPAADVPLV